MDDILKKEKLINKIQRYIKSYFKLIISFIFLAIMTFAIFQFYNFNKDKKMFESSILYNFAKSDIKSEELYKRLEALSKSENFYGIMSKLEKIKLTLNNSDIENAYEDYINILNDNKLNNYYKSAISVKASYSLINLINNNNTDSFFDVSDYQNIINKVLKLIFYIDDNLTSYKGYKLEILYLISIINYENNLNNNIDKTEILFKKIQQDDGISSLLKERVKKINDFQKYQ